MVSLTLSLGDVGGGGGAGGDGGARLAGNLPWIKNCSLEVQGELEAGKPQETPWREAGESGEGASIRVGVGDLLTRCH